ncbi:MAG: biotin--[acetyl-CoA-carboxylase] ligase [Planctomycetaceae bacterium]
MPDLREALYEAFLGAFRPFPEGLRRETLAERCGVPVADLPLVREELVQRGFRFEEDAEGRWKLVEPPDLIVPYWVRAGLRCDRLARQIYYRDEVKSTQDVAFELMVEGREHGTLVVADHQTEGRGRGDRTWHSTRGQSLLVSLLLDLEPPDTFASVLTVAMTTAIARAIQDVADLPARIKFPNDVFVRGKKVAGILLEVRDYGLPTPRAVAGLGVNVNQEEGDFPPDLREIATSLRAERRDGQPVLRARLLRNFLRELEKWLDQIAQGQYDDLENAWNRFSSIEEKEVSFRAGAEEVSGRVLDARIRTGLLLRLPGGEERRFRLEHITTFRYL